MEQCPIFFRPLAQWPAGSAHEPGEADIRVHQAHGPNGYDGAARKFRERFVRNLAEQPKVLGFPSPRVVKHPDAAPNPFDLN